MTSKTSLLGGAAAGVLMALAAGSVATAAPASSQDIEALRQQVAELQAALNQQAKAQADIQAQLAATQAHLDQQAAQAQQQAAAQDAQLQTIPSQVQTAVAAIPASAPKPGWFDNTVVSGRMFYNISGIDQKSDGQKVAPSGTGFDIKRLYIGIDHKFNNVWSANVTTDVNYISNDSETQLYLKKAYLQAKISDAFVVRLGSADLPWVPFVEDLYGYRYVENTLIDRTKFGTSADWGVHVGGKFGDKGMFSYAVSAVDGAGYKAPLRSQGIDLEGRLSMNIAHFTAGVGGYTGKRGADVQGVDTVHTANRFNAVVAYTTPRVRLGVEYFYADDWNNVLTLTEDKSDGYSLFGSYAFNDKFGVFGRYDWVKPRRDTTPDGNDDYFNVGVSYTPTKIVDFALVYKRERFDNGFISTSNGSIGGLNNGTYDEFGLFGQLRY